MRVFNSFDEAEGKLDRVVVTTGSFDGVHIGHKEIIKKLNKERGNIHGESLLITFHPHPRKVLYPEQKDFKLLTSQSEKIELLEKEGLDNLIIVNFTAAFSKITPRKYVVDYLLGKLDAKVIAVGNNHRFGPGRQGDYNYLKKLAGKFNFRVEEISLRDIENEKISSNKIRKALYQGNIKQANAFLGYNYFISGLISRGAKFPANDSIDAMEIKVEEKEKLIPPPGIYAIKLTQERKSMKGIVAIYNDKDKQQKIAISLFNEIFAENNFFGVLSFYERIKKW